jgi:hypothetical protein
MFKILRIPQELSGLFLCSLDVGEGVPIIKMEI